jgi:Glyoxalase-like domain
VVTGYALSPPRGPRSDFATLVPGEGDAYMRVQRIHAGAARCHLDFPRRTWQGWRHGPVNSAQRGCMARMGSWCSAPPAGCRSACRKKTTGLPSRRLPGGLPGSVSRVDQFCLDIPADVYEAECGFWADLTGWGSLLRPAGMPLRLLLRRSGDQPGTPVRARPGLACSGVCAEVARHEALGATRSGHDDRWVAMRDPAGLAYWLG